MGGGLAAGTVSALTRIPIDQALYLRYYGKMGKEGYQAVRLAMLPYGVALPPYSDTTSYKYRNIVPSQLVSSSEIHFCIDFQT